MFDKLAVYTKHPQHKNDEEGGKLHLRRIFLSCPFGHLLSGHKYLYLAVTESLTLSLRTTYIIANIILLYILYYSLFLLLL